jgi:HSP20 family molecular chaperone IbpA
MSRFTLLEGELWRGRVIQTYFFGKSPEAGYPPYNIELVRADEGSPEILRITLAVAGFALEELSVTVENAQLIIRGQQMEPTGGEFLYRGLAARRFKRSFGLASGVEIRKAELHNGLLSVELERPEREATVRRVPIAGSDRSDARVGTLKGGGAVTQDAEKSR